jgi:hypothetical protein
MARRSLTSGSAINACATIPARRFPAATALAFGSVLLAVSTCSIAQIPQDSGTSQPEIMFLRPVVPFVVALTCVSVTACVTNMASVATFGDATSTVSQETSVALTRMSQGCTDLLILISSQRTLGTSVLSRGDPTPYKSTPSRAQYSDAQWKTLANYVKSLQGQEGELSSECAQMARFAPIMQGVGASLAAYASAIKALAQNEFVTYKPVPHFQLEAISAIPTDGPDPLLTQPQVAAIGVLQMLLHKAATESYQQDKLKEVLS